DCVMERLGESRGIGPLERQGNEATCKITMKPYDLVAARLSAPNVRVRNPAVVIPDYVKLGLERRIKDLSARVAALGNPQATAAVENPGFEMPGQSENIAGWKRTTAGSSTVTLDAAQHHAGGQSLKLVSRGQPAAVTSAPFPAPSTGRIAVEFY